jgi:sulfur dioxygenase
MIFRQLFDSATSTFTYLLADEITRTAILIDCVFEQHLRDLALIRELNLTLASTLETHIHADHVTGAWLMKEALGSTICVARAAGAEGADRELAPGDSVQTGQIELKVRATPGHTDGCLTYVSADQSVAFTGDALLIRGAGRTDFQGGSAARLFQSVHSQVFSLNDSCLLYPGHDYSGRTVTSVAEEKAYNPRLGTQVREEDFVGYMKNLNLPHPKKMADAVPANLKCGRPEKSLHDQSSPDWGPVVRTYAGVWQVEPDWVYAHSEELTLLDVREREEAEVDLLGHLKGAILLPLSELRHSVREVPEARPVVTICPSGARSAIAAQILEGAGRKVANLRGGLLMWRDLGYPL